METTSWVLRPARALWKFLSTLWANGNNNRCYPDGHRDFVGQWNGRPAEIREYFCSCGNPQHTQQESLHCYY